MGQFELMNPLLIISLNEKLLHLEAACHHALTGESFFIPECPGRDVETLPIKQLPFKPGLSQLDGQARLLHDLASIELQAMELGFRTLIEYPHAETFFREQLVEIILDESRHLKMCIEQLIELGYKWGAWPVHLGLWQAVSEHDSLLDRILIVHRYLEGSGLDAGEKLLRRLSGVEQKGTREIVQVITREEIGHVRFGSSWYRRICEQNGIDASEDFYPRLKGLFHKIPRRREKLDKELRKKAGFTLREISEIEILRDQQR